MEELLASTAAADREAERLRERLAELEVEHATLNSELRAFEADYLRRVGVIDVQVQELEARILALVFAESGLDEDSAAADAAEQRFRETTTALKSIPAPAGPPPTDDLKLLFRDAAKRMHPDLVADEAGREHAEAFMKRLNQAYQKGDAEAIGNLVRQWESSPYARGTPVVRGPCPAHAGRGRARRAATRRGTRLRPRAADGGCADRDHDRPRPPGRVARVVGGGPGGGAEAAGRAAELGAEDVGHGRHEHREHHEYDDAERDPPGGDQSWPGRDRLGQSRGDGRDEQALEQAERGEREHRQPPGPTSTKSKLSARSGSIVGPASTTSTAPSIRPPARPAGSPGRSSA